MPLEGVTYGERYYPPPPPSFCMYIVYDGGRSSVVRASGKKSEDHGFDCLAGQGERQFVCPSESTLVQILFVPTPLARYICTARTHIYMLKIPYPSVVKK